MTATLRIAWENLLQKGTATLAVSSENTAAPGRWLADQLRSKMWRSKVGWNIVTGFNDYIDFNNGTDRNALLTAGNYATGDLFAAQIQTAMAAAYGTGTWTVTYSSSTHKFTITHSATAFSLEFATGTNATRTACKELGFTNADVVSALSQVSTNAVYCSREYIVADLTTASAVSACYLIDENLTSSAVVKVQGSATTLDATGADTSPTVNQTLSGDPLLKFFATQTYRYWRILIDDCGNSLGYVSVGVPFIGAYDDFTDGYAVGFSAGRNELSTREMADRGAHFVNEKPGAQLRDLALLMLSDAEYDDLKLVISNCPPGKNFIVSLDPVSDPDNTLYMYLDGRVSVVHVPLASGDSWTASLPLREALA